MVSGRPGAHPTSWPMPRADTQPQGTLGSCPVSGQPPIPGGSRFSVYILGTSTSVTQLSRQGQAEVEGEEGENGAGVGEARAQPLGQGGLCPPDSGFSFPNPGGHTSSLATGRQLTLPVLVFLPVSWAQSTACGLPEFRERIGTDYVKPSEVFSDGRLS